MHKPILVVMAAGIGSRYGGLKQTDPVGPNNELIIDYSVYDAIHAGFEKVIFIINKTIEADFQQLIGKRLASHIHVAYAYQSLLDLPETLSLPDKRVKPLGTAHAIYSARHLIDAPFAVINADDYYGRDAFIQIYNYLSQPTLKDTDYTMIGYALSNTVTQHGYVSRGVCTLDADSFLTNIVERVHIEYQNNAIVYLDENNHAHPLSPNTFVSMNMWGFTSSFIQEITHTLEPFFHKSFKENPLKCEYFLPYVVDKLLQEKLCSVKVLTTTEKWYGVTYSEDKLVVVEALQKMILNHRYPENLWEA